MVQDDTLKSPLHYACENGQADIAEILLKKYKCDPNCLNVLGLTPIQVVTPSKRYGSWDTMPRVIKVLVENKAHLNVVDSDGNTPLHKVCKFSNVAAPESVKCLLEEGKCDPDIKNNAGLTPLQIIIIKIITGNFCAVGYYFDTYLFYPGCMHTSGDILISNAR